MAIFALLVAGTFVSSVNADDERPVLSNEQFWSIKTVLKNANYPLSEPEFRKIISANREVKWVFDHDRRSGPNSRSYSYFSIEPYISGSGGYCIEGEYGARNTTSTPAIVVGAKICFVSRFGAIFYEDCSGEKSEPR